MLRKLRERIYTEEKGFTLIELLVVILIIGILAAIALPAFLNQRGKGQDAEAKSNARNLVSEVESCYADTEDYQGCDDEATAPLNQSGLPLGSADGQADVVSADADSYTITGYSKSGNEFEIEKLNGAAPDRNCTTGGTFGCPAGGADW